MADESFQVFNGGINNFIEPHLLEKNMSVDLIDANVTDGGISSFNGTGALAVTDNEFLVNQNTKGTRSLVKWDNEIYFSDNDTQELSSTLGFMGIDPPTSIIQLSANDKGNRFSGDFKYIVTFETEEGFESSPFQPDDLTQSATINTVIEDTVLTTADYPQFATNHIFIADSNGNHAGYHAGEKVTFLDRNWEARVDVRSSAGRGRPLQGAEFPGVNLDLWRDITTVTITASGFERIILRSFPQSTQSAVKFLNIYRTLVNGSTFFKLATVDRGISRFEDSVSDAALLLNEQLNLSILNFPPLLRFDNGTQVKVGGRFLTEVNGDFFLANGDRLYKSRPNDPHSWDPRNFVKFDSIITAIAKEEDGVLVFTENRTYLVPVTIQGVQSKQEIDTVQGCPNWRTIASGRNRVIWQSNDGLCAFSKLPNREGKFIEILTENRFVFPRQANFAIFANDIYYSFFDNEVVCFDFQRGLLTYKRTITSVFGIYEKNTDRVILRGNINFEVLDGGSAVEWTYLSPEHIIGDINELKRFRRLWVDADSSVDIKVLVDKTEKLNKRSDATGRRQFYLAPGTIGERLQLEMKGTGRLRGYKIEYYPSNRRI